METAKLTAIAIHSISGVLSRVSSHVKAALLTSGSYSIVVSRRKRHMEELYKLHVWFLRANY
jgi:hypothetical protein